MLNVRKSHIDFGERLQPPPGYEIDYAVATTYSLDLYALLSIPLAMYYRQNLDSEISENNFQILEAIQNLHKHLKIFVHKGKIALPKSTSVSLLAFVEKCVIEVMPNSAYQSFHPKVWVLRFKESGTRQSLYRVIVMSRNLTFDKSYDIAYWMEGIPEGGAKPENKELVQLMHILNRNSEFSHRTFIRDLAKVPFKIDEPFQSYGFSLLPTKSWEKTIDADKIYAKRLVISPFLSARKVTLLNEKSKAKLILFSRKNELDKLPVDLISRIEPYCFEQEIVNHHLYEKAEEGEQDEYNGGEWDNNLHAKLYLRQDSTNTYWDFGSANCSNAAFGGNHEFLIHLASGWREADIDAIKAELTHEYNGVRVFKPYERISEVFDALIEEDFRTIEYELLKCITNSTLFDAWVEPNEKYYDLHLQIELPGVFNKGGYQLSCNPLGLKSNTQLVESKQVISFNEMPLHKLTSFIHWQISAAGKGRTIDMVTKIDIRNMPEYRLSNILRSIIDRPEKFMALLMALLSNEPQSISLPNDDDSNAIGTKVSGRGLSKSPQFDTPIYEELLINLSRNPERLIRLSEVIEKLVELNEQEIIPTEFTRIWETIREILPNE